MSSYEGLNGDGRLKKEDFQKLRKLLIPAYNRDVDRVNKDLKECFEENGKEFSDSDKKKYATEDQSIFILYSGVDDFGGIFINEACGKLIFSINYGNHAVEDIEFNSKTYRALMSFIQKMPTNNTEYGVHTCCRGEHYPEGGTWSYYGGWKLNKN